MPLIFLQTKNLVRQKVNLLSAEKIFFVLNLNASSESASFNRESAEKNFFGR